MGIPSYFSYIVKNHSNIIKKFNPNITPHNLYLDSNSIIYDAVYSLGGNPSTSTIINKVLETIRKYITLIKPSKCVYIALDGVAPVAKLEQQRSRRFKSVYQQTITNGLMQSEVVNIEGKEENTIIASNLIANWNTASITPGTLFMKTLNTAIFERFNNPNEYQLETILFSGSNECGEGEHKIFQYIRDNETKHSDEITYVYGLDADLIMLSLNHLHMCPNLYLFRETPEFIKSLNSELDPLDNYVLNISELSSAIAGEMINEKDVSKLNSVVKTRLTSDYILLCFFLGNDFMPHFPALNIRTTGITKLLNAYNATCLNKNGNITYLTHGEVINWKQLRSLLYFLSVKEHDYIKIEQSMRFKKSKYRQASKTLDDKINAFNNLPSYERNVEEFINPYKDGWQNRYYYSLLNVDVTENERPIDEICVNYLEALEWTWKYYMNRCPNWRWRYRYNYPPLLEDLVRRIPLNYREFMPYAEANNSVSELVQLCYVLPKQSLSMLPTKLYKAITTKRICDYAVECDFSWSYCKYFWECHPNLPDIDIDDLERFVKEYS